MGGEGSGGYSRIGYWVRGDERSGWDVRDARVEELKGRK